MDTKELIRNLLSRIEDKKPFTIGIYGHGASGKTTFAKALVQTLGAERVNLLETDPYIISGENRSSVYPKNNDKQKVTACMAIAHECESLRRDILSLKSGLDIMTIDTFYSPSKRLEANKPILIVEGMSVGFIEKSVFDLLICFYTDDETELSRRLIRDTTERGRSSEFIRKTSKSRRAQYYDYYKWTEDKADILVRQTMTGSIIERK